MAVPVTYSIRNLSARKLTTLLTAGGMALVVFVFTAMQMLDAGLTKTLVQTGSSDNMLVIRKGSETEVQSGVSRQQAAVIESQQGIVRRPDGMPMVSKETVVLINLVKRGWLAVSVPSARATEKMVPSVEGEFARKRRMMGHTWPIVVRGGLVDPRGYPPRYALLIASHRVLRYLTPFLHVALLLASLRRPRMLAAQLAVLGAAAAGRGRGGLIARYYVLTTASIALGLYDWLRHGTTAGWEAAEGTR